MKSKIDLFLFYWNLLQFSSDFVFWYNNNINKYNFFTDQLDLYKSGISKVSLSIIHTLPKKSLYSLLKNWLQFKLMNGNTSVDQISCCANKHFFRKREISFKNVFIVFIWPCWFMFRFLANYFTGLYRVQSRYFLRKLIITRC